MVAFTTAALVSLVAAGAIAGPVDKRNNWSGSGKKGSHWYKPHGGWWHHGQEECLSDAAAQQVADNYAELIRNYSDELALASLTKDFTDYSESVNTLINTCPQGDAAKPLPLLAPTFSSRQQFMTGQGQQPKINFEQLNIAHDCKTVTIRWKTTNTAPIPSPRPVVGIILLENEKAPEGSKYPWLTSTVYSEFDSGAWLQNLQEAGICTATNPSSPAVNIPPSSTAAATPSATATTA